MAYTTEAKIKAVYGTKNVDRWADLNNSGDAGEITATVAAAIAYADAQVDGRLRGGIYTVPFEADPNTPPIIANIAADLAAERLYRARRYEDTDDAGDMLAAAKQAAERQLSAIRVGRITLSVAATYTTAPDVPDVPGPEDDDTVEDLLNDYAN